MAPQSNGTKHNQDLADEAAESSASDQSQKPKEVYRGLSPHPIIHCRVNSAGQVAHSVCNSYSSQRLKPILE
jgi:hypothetical protein